MIRCRGIQRRPYRRHSVLGMQVLEAIAPEILRTQLILNSDTMHNGLPDYNTYHAAGSRST